MTPFSTFTQPAQFLPRPFRRKLEDERQEERMSFWKQASSHTLVTASAFAVMFIGFSPGNAQSNPELTLEQALKALPNSLDWQQADLSYLTAQKSLDSARAAAGLRVNAGADTNLGFPSSGNSSQTLSVSATASLTVLPWSSTFDAVRSAERALIRAELDRNDSRSTLALNVFNQYFTARLSSSDVELGKTNLGLSEAQLKVATAQQKNGQISKDTLLNAQKSLETSKLNLEQAINILEVNRLTVWNTLNLEISDAVFSSIPSERALSTASLDDLTAQALTKRSDVQKALSRISDAQDALSSAQRDRVLPNASVNVGVTNTSAGSLSSGLNLQTGSLSVTGTVPIVANTTTTTGSSAASNLTISASVSFAIVAPSGDTKISSAETTLESAKKTLAQTKQTARLDVRQKFNDAKLTVAKLNLAKTTSSNAKSGFETAKARFEAGLNTPNDLEQSRIAVLQSERDLEQAVINQVLAAYRLENAVGALNIIPGGNL
jgi:outer membrane protein